ncbi:MAG: hypothetical protein U0992_25395, partial [Planctomycetaceae bacterium]
SHRALYIVVGALALAAPPLLLRAAPDNWNDVQQAVAAMPQPERDRLNRNIQEYETLSDGQREQYRRLHAALQDDAANNSGKLNATMEGYYAWLGSNPAYDRQTLRNAADPNARLLEVQRIVDERNEQASRFRSRWWRGFLQDAPELTPVQLEVLMGKIEGRIPTLNADDVKKLQTEDGVEKTGIARYFALFSIMRHHKLKLDQLVDQMDLDAAIAEVPDLTMPAWFENADPNDRRFLFVRMIIGNVLREYGNEVQRTPPTTEDLEKLVAQWPGDRDELERILEEEPADFRAELEREYFARQPNALDPRDLWGVLPDWRGGFRGGPRFPGGEGGRNGFFRGGRPGEGRFGRGDRFGPPEGPPPDGPPPDGAGGPPRGDRGSGPDGERRPRREGARGPVPVNPPPMP